MAQYSRAGLHCNTDIDLLTHINLQTFNFVIWKIHFHRFL